MRILGFISIVAILFSSVILFGQASSEGAPFGYLSQRNKDNLIHQIGDFHFHNKVDKDSPQVQFIPNFSNPVEVGVQDSVDISINIVNQSSSPFPWVAYISEMITGNESESFSWPLQLAVQLGDSDNSGCEFDGVFFYITHAFSPNIEKYDQTGVFIETFTIPGITSLREIVFDGTYMYGVSGGQIIHIMDFLSQQSVGTISIPITPQHIAYDSGEDGFWIGGWNTDLLLINRSGSVLSTVPISALGISVIGGSAYDNHTPGGPFLWIFGEPPGGGQPTYLTQISLLSGTITGLTYNVANDFSVNNPAAGGLYSTSAFIPGTFSIGGILKGTPEYLFAYNISNSDECWLKLLAYHGVVPPVSNIEVPLRVFGIPYDTDSLQVNFPTNDPLMPLVCIPIIRQVVISGINDYSIFAKHFSLFQNYPNPFNPTTTISYQLSAMSFVTLKVYDLLGQEITSLVNERKTAGKHQVVWDASMMPSGIYYYQLQAGEYQEVKKMMLMK